MPQFATDYWRRQDQHIANTLHRLVNERPPPMLEHGEESQRLHEAKASYDRMLAHLSVADRALVERLMTSELTMLLLAITSAASDLAIKACRCASPAIPGAGARPRSYSQATTLGRVR
jgi:hypothetical protein